MRITRVTPFTNTCASNQGGTSLRDAFHRDWDKKAGIEQAMVRVDRRVAQGTKKTPIGAGKLKRT